MHYVLRSHVESRPQRVSRPELAEKQPRRMGSGKDTSTANELATHHTKLVIFGNRTQHEAATRPRSWEGLYLILMS